MRPQGGLKKEGRRIFLRVIGFLQLDMKCYDN